MKPKIGKFPIEIFGHPYTDYMTKEERAMLDLKCQLCPYSSKECFKNRKSEASIKIGICSVGYKGSKNANYEPVIICPNRFEGSDSPIFQDIQDKFFPHWKNVHWVKEVSMGEMGNVDYVAFEMDGDKIKDFLCVEIQAGGTTGTPFPAREDLLQKGHYRSDWEKYKFGINWANEFAKTMMQQVYKKGQTIVSWGRKIVFVVQNLAMNYIGVERKDVYRHDLNDPIFFASYSLDWDDEYGWFYLGLNNWYSTDLAGVQKILSYDNKELSVDDFKQNILSKALKDKLI